MEGQIQDWGTALMTSLTAAFAMFFAAIPKILAFLVILVVGWFLASLVAKGVATLLRSVNFDALAVRSGFSGFVHRMGVDNDASGFIAVVTKWFVRLIALVVAFDALGLPAVSGVLRQLLLWLPNVIVALVVLVIGGLAAQALSRLVRGATAQADLGDPTLLGRVASVAVWSFAIVVAVNQLGIATALINTLFMATVGAVALAVGLAFGLGGRETAADMLRSWRERSRLATPRIEQAARAASDQAREMGGDGHGAPRGPHSPRH